MSIYLTKSAEDNHFSRMTRTEQLLEINRRLRSLPTLIAEQHENTVFKIKRTKNRALITLEAEILHAKRVLSERDDEIDALKEALSKKDAEIASLKQPAPPSPSSSADADDHLLSLAQILDVAGAVLERVEGRHSADAALVDYLKELMKNAAARVEQMRQAQAPSPQQIPKSDIQK